MNTDDNKKKRIESFLLRDNATFVSAKGTTLKKTIITFKCMCGKEHMKGFLTLKKYDGSARCKECTNKQMMTKIAETNNAKYGYDYAILVEEVKQKAADAKKSEEYKEKISKIRKKKFENNEIKPPEITLKIIEKRKKTYFEKTGYDHPFKNPEVMKKRINKSLEKYGTKYPIMNQEVKDKALQTMEKNTGKQYALQKEESKTKQKDTMVKKFGVEHSTKVPELVQKAKNTCLKKYGTEFYSQHPEFFEKVKKTCNKKYGVNHPMQYAQIIEKTIASSYKRKEYITLKGNKLICQGYENYALDELFIEQKLNEEDIINGTSKVPIIAYIGTNKKERKHFVDIYLPKQNKCIEVKSTYLFAKDKENILNKQKAGKEMGYEYEIWIYGDRKVDRKKYKLDDIDAIEEKKGKMYKIIIV
jgi:hypothetical protein